MTPKNDKAEDTVVQIYLDNNSTTPIDPEVLEAMLPYFTSRFGNPSNLSHRYGADAADAVERARSQVAELIGASPKEIVFTSGATESNNLALFGTCRYYRERANNVVTVVTEHKAVLEPCKQLEREGWRITYLAVDNYGQVDLDALERAITPDTVLVTVMTANNEIGTLQPIPDVSAVCKRLGVLFHSDAAQAIGRVPVDVDEMGIDLLSISAHKMYGPKGVGALYVRGNGSNVRLDPLLHGGGQEKGLRSGTLPVPSIVGLGAACAIAHRNLTTEPARVGALREQLRQALVVQLPDVCVHGHPTEHLPGLLSVGFPGIDGDALLYSMHGVAVSQGASCSAGSFEPSYVLRALGISDELARASFRFGVGRFNSSEEIELAANVVVHSVKRLRR